MLKALKHRNKKMLHSTDFKAKYDFTSGFSKNSGEEGLNDEQNTIPNVLFSSYQVNVKKFPPPTSIFIS